MSGNVQVTKTESGWTITKGDSTFNVEDKNKNNRLDDNEVSERLSGKGFLETDDINEAMGLVLQEKGAKMTLDEMAQYSDFMKRKEQQSQQQQGQTQNQNQAQEQKPLNFWQKLGKYSMMGVTGLLGATQNVLGMFLGWGGNGNSWAYGGGFNDYAVRLNGMGSNNYLNNTDSMGMMNFGGQIQGGQGAQGGMNYSQMFAQIAEAENKRMAETQKTIEKMNKDNEVKNKENEEKQTKENGVNLMERAFDSVKEDEDNEMYCKENADYVKDKYSIESEEYDKETMSNVEKIGKYGQIPFSAIETEKEAKGKLSEKVAKRLNEFMTEYYGANDSIKQDMLTPEELKNINGIITKAKQGQMTDADKTWITKLLKSK